MARARAAGGSSRARAGQGARPRRRSQLDRQWRKVRRRGAELAALDADAEHQLRIDVKKLRYAAEFLAPLHRRTAAASRFIAALKDLQEQLGVANDARIARR